jgi:MIP family channel proteins
MAAASAVADAAAAPERSTPAPVIRAEPRLRVWHKYAAEALGTFGLVLAGTGAVVVNAQTGGTISQLGVALVFGFVVLALISALGHISGAHINPAVTLAFAITRHFPWRDVPGYIGAQLAGAAAASLVVLTLIGDQASLGATLPSGPVWQSLGLETVLTFFLMLVIMAVATDTRAVGQMAALAIGLTVALSALWAGPVSGASMNPARSFGPALLSGNLGDLWIYVAGPVAGAILGALVYQWLKGEVRRPE